MAWSVAYGPRDTGPEYELNMNDLALSFVREGAPHTLTGTVDARAASSIGLLGRVCDVWARRDGVLYFRGPLMTLDRTADQDQHNVVVTANSYRARLANWPYMPSLSRQAIINHNLGTFPLHSDGPILGWLMLTDWIAGGINGPTDLDSIIVNDYGLTAKGASLSNTTALQIGTDIATNIDTLVSIQQFDWDMIPHENGTVGYMAWQGNRGSAKPNVVLTYGGEILGFSQADFMSTFANMVFVSSTDSGGNPVWAQVSSPYGPEGRWVAIFNGNGADTTNAIPKAQTLLQQFETPAPTRTLTVKPGWWQGMSHLWLGDRPTVVIKDGGLNVSASPIVEQFDITSVDGTENVTITTGGPAVGHAGNIKIAKTLRDLAKRIRAVENNQ